MDYNFKSPKIVPYLFVSLLFTFVTILDLLHLGYLKSHILIVCETVFIIIFWYVTLQLVYLMVFKKPVLSISESGIFDRVNNVRYRWEDIVNISESNTVLRIDLRNPQKYLSRIKDPIQACVIALAYWLYGKKSPYVINMSLVDANSKDVVKELSTYMSKTMLGASKVS